MNTLQEINDFFASKKMAIAGVSRDKKKFGYTIFAELKGKGFEIYPLNPNAEQIDETPCFANLHDIPEAVENLLIVTPKSQTYEVVKEAIDKGVKRIWLQQMSDTPEAIDLAKKSGVSLIAKKCVFMFSEPVQGFHKFHRSIIKLFGAYPS